MTDADEIKREYLGSDQLGREAVAIRYDDGDVTIALSAGRGDDADPVNDPGEVIVLSVNQFKELQKF